MTSMQYLHLRKGLVFQDFSISMPYLTYSTTECGKLEIVLFTLAMKVYVSIDNLQHIYNCVFVQILFHL